MAEIKENGHVEKEFVDPTTKVWVKDTGELIFDPSSEDRRYPFMPTVTEVLVGYCIESDLEVPRQILTKLPDNLRGFVEKQWNDGYLKQRRLRNERDGIVMKGNPLDTSSFIKEALRSRGVDAETDILAYGIFQIPILAVAGNNGLQKSLEKRLPVDLKGILGKEGFDSYLRPY